MYRQSEKNLLSSNISSTCPHNMVNFGPLAAENVSLVWGTPGNFNGFRVLASLLHGTLVVGVSQTAALNRGRHLYSAGRPSRWALAHISSFRDVSGSLRHLFTCWKICKSQNSFRGLSQSPTTTHALHYVRDSERNFFIPYICQIFSGHDVGAKAMRNVCYYDIHFLRTSY